MRVGLQASHIGMRWTNGTMGVADAVAAPFDLAYHAEQYAGTAGILAHSMMGGFSLGASQQSVSPKDASELKIAAVLHGASALGYCLTVSGHPLVGTAMSVASAAGLLMFSVPDRSP